MSTITLTQDGSAVSLALPADTRRRLGLEPGQAMTLIELADGVKLVRHDPALERQLAMARAVLEDERAALRQIDGA